MGIGDKIGNQAEELKGRAKEAAGTAADDDGLKNEGKADQAAATVKKGVEDLKDKAGAVVDKITGD